MRKVKLHGVLAVVALLWACGGDDKRASQDAGQGQEQEPATTPEPEALDFAEFDALVEAFVQEHALEGATAVVVHRERGTVHERGYGGFDEKRVSLIASSSKIVSVGVLMALVDAGKLDLDQPISRYLSAWGEHKTDITTAMLVSNSSGLIALSDTALYAPYLCQYLDAGSLESCAQSIYQAADEADRRPPDTGFAYGGGQWQLAGGIAQAVSGKSWAELIQETYVEPCGTQSLGYTNQFSRANAEGSGTAYPKFFQADVANLPQTENPSIEGGAYITAGDYGKILLMHLREGLCDDERALSEASVARMQVDRVAEAYQGSTSSPVLAGYGLGWWVDREHPGVVVDPGAYGASAWLDGPRGYGAFLVLETTSALGTQLRTQVKPVLDAIFDAASD
jgi:CubicO group peptidase (beta-lactamase class C family)